MGPPFINDFIYKNKIAANSADGNLIFEVVQGTLYQSRTMIGWNRDTLFQIDLRFG